LRDVHSDTAFDDVHTKENFVFAMDSLQKAKYQLRLPKYDIAIDDNADPEPLVRQFMLTAADIFLYTGALDFFLLHGVTSMRALEVVLSHIKDKQVKREALRYFWRAVVCTYISQERPTIQEVDKYISSNIEWKEIIEKALSYNDEHLIKLVFVTHDEAQKVAGDKAMLMYKEAALRALNHYIENSQSWNYLR